MITNLVYVGDIGTKVRADIGISANDVTNCKFIVKKPSGTIVEWGATPETDTNYIYYIIQSGDLDEAGTYEIQAYVETADWQGYGSKAKFSVNKHI